MLREYGDQGKVLAGGTDLLVSMKYGTSTPRMLIGLKALPRLKLMDFNEIRGLRLGALVTHEAIAGSPIIKSRYGALASACARIGTPQIRHMGTIGGNVCNASPSADSLPPLIAYGAAARLVTPDGERSLPLENFCTGPGQNACEAGEILSGISVPCPAPHTVAAYVRLPARTAEDIAAVSVAVAMTFDPERQSCREIRIVLGAVAPTPIRAGKAEEMLRGERLCQELVERAAQEAAEDACPLSDVRSSAAYRKEMVRVLTRQAISEVAELAGATAW